MNSFIHSLLIPISVAELDPKISRFRCNNTFCMGLQSIAGYHTHLNTLLSPRGDVHCPIRLPACFWEPRINACWDKQNSQNSRQTRPEFSAHFLLGDVCLLFFFFQLKQCLLNTMFPQNDLRMSCANSSHFHSKHSSLADFLKVINESFFFIYLSDILIFLRLDSNPQGSGNARLCKRLRLRTSQDLTPASQRGKKVCYPHGLSE